MGNIVILILEETLSMTSTEQLLKNALEWYNTLSTEMQLA